MAVTLNASTTAGLIQTADTTGNLSLQSNGTTIAALTSTGLAVTGAGSFSTTLGVTGTSTLAAVNASGTLTLTKNNDSLSLVPTTATSGSFISLTNTGGTSYFGIENSSGGSLLTGAAAYGAVITSAGGRILYLGTGGANIGLSISGTAVTIPGNTTFGASGVNVVTKIFSADSASLNLSVNNSNAANRNFGIGTSYAAYGQMDIRVGASLGSDPFSGGVLIMGLTATGVAIAGSLSKGSGSFLIPHPLPALNETHNLVHSFIEGPQADLIYRGRISLVAGKATINIDTASTMTEGTFELLCRDVQCFTSNETDWSPVRGSVVGNTLTIECQDTASVATISWMVIGERKDQHMLDTELTDENGKVIVEPLKPIPLAVEEPQDATQNRTPQ